MAFVKRKTGHLKIGDYVEIVDAPEIFLGIKGYVMNVWTNFEEFALLKPDNADIPKGALLDSAGCLKFWSFRLEKIPTQREIEELKLSSAVQEWLCSK